LVFRYTQAADDGSTVNSVAEDDVLTVAAQNILLNSGTIVDTGTAVNSGVAIPANTISLTASA
jgi:IMP dehydrogenase/GMP reductase